VAGLEALLALQDLAGDRVETTLLEPNTEFAFRPMATAEAFGRGRGQRIPMTRVASHVGTTLRHGRLARVDEPRRVAVLDDGGEVEYDALLVAIGAGSEPAFRRALTWTPESDPEVFGGLRQDIEEGYAKNVAFAVPLGVSWPLPAYELAMMTASAAHSMGQDDVRVTVVTPEHAPLEMFGVAGSAAVRADLDAAGVAVETDTFVEETHDPPGFVMQPGDRVLEGRVVALPRAVGPAIEGLTLDSRGFIRVDRQGKMAGAERVWAAGDATAFPVKQGGIAAQQADAAAQAIAALAGADVEPKPFHPVLRGMLLTGRGEEWLRAQVAGGGADSEAEQRHALWWPPTKVAGAYLAPYLQEIAEADQSGQTAAPSGQAVELDLEQALPAAADALRAAP
jgi:sulfide:quinone oxidoreductase